MSEKRSNEEGRGADEDAKAAVPATSTKGTAKAGLLQRVRLDPATGIGIFVPGLFVMAIGGAATWHWVFNVGEGIMLAGMTYFVVAVAWTALQQRGGKGESGPPAATAS